MCWAMASLRYVRFLSCLVLMKGVGRPATQTTRENSVNKYKYVQRIVFRFVRCGKSPAQRRCSSGVEWLYTEQRLTSESILSLNKDNMRTDFCFVSNRFPMTSASGIICDGSVQRTMDWANSMTIMTSASIAPVNTKKKKTLRIY